MCLAPAFQETGQFGIDLGRHHHRQDHPLVALRAAAQTTGSLVLALALADGRLDAEAAFEASQLDESYQIGFWGEDHEAARRRDHLRAEIADIARFMACLRDDAPAAPARTA